MYDEDEIEALLDDEIFCDKIEEILKKHHSVVYKEFAREDVPHDNVADVVAALARVSLMQVALERVLGNCEQRAQFIKELDEFEKFCDKDREK